MNDIKRLFNNPDPRIRHLTEALLRLVPVEKAHPRDLRRRLNDEAEARFAAKEARGTCATIGHMWSASEPQVCRVCGTPRVPTLERVGINELLDS